ncbi:hypothetical protein [Streptomyces sp. NPDC051909]|uniref:hypothetical protein n=1 Tax=Streptomyces sp. NPDC051909 TaxID=3154944 RepID=UPI00344A29CD
MPEQLLAPLAADPERDSQEPEAEPRETIDTTALRALRDSRTDVEALDLTAERLRHFQDAFAKAADTSRTRTGGGSSSYCGHPALCRRVVVDCTENSSKISKS